LLSEKAFNQGWDNDPIKKHAQVRIHRPPLALDRFRIAGTRRTSSNRFPYIGGNRFREPLGTLGTRALS